MKAGRKLIVALDGPAGSGKSTAGKRVAASLGYDYIDTGAMYRVVGLIASEKGIDPRDDAALGDILAELRFNFESLPQGRRIIANGRDVTSSIRSSAIGQWASKVSARPVVREGLVSMQRRLGAAGGVVMDGRDIGTVVFPSAEIKVYLDATLQERAKRRHLELCAAGQECSYDQVLKDVQERDRRDATRQDAPLRPAADAIIVDTTEHTPGEVVERILALVRNRVRS